MTLISAMQAAAYYEPDRSGGAYPTREAYLADVVALLRREIEELVRLGCTYIQIDGPAYGSLVDERMREGFRERGADPDRLLDEAIEMDNAVIAGFPGITFALHICRGNNQSHYYASGGYEPIAKVLERTNFQRFMLEYDTERSGGFEPLRHQPEDRVALLGLITTKQPELESAEQVKARLNEAATLVPLERLVLSTQCGFASTREGNRVTEEDQRRKLDLVAQVAREVWGTLQTPFPVSSRKPSIPSTVAKTRIAPPLPYRRPRRDVDIPVCCVTQRPEFGVYKPTKNTRPYSSE